MNFIVWAQVVFLFTLQIVRMAGASHYDGIKKQVSRNDQLEEDKKTVKVDKLILAISFPGSITFLFIEYAFHLLMIRWLWWEMVLWARLASALFIHRSRNFYTDYHTTTQINIRIITVLHGLYKDFVSPRKPSQQATIRQYLTLIQQIWCLRTRKKLWVIQCCFRAKCSIFVTESVKIVSQFSGETSTNINQTFSCRQWKLTYGTQLAKKSLKICARKLKYPMTFWVFAIQGWPTPTLICSLCASAWSTVTPLKMLATWWVTFFWEVHEKRFTKR